MHGIRSKLHGGSQFCPGMWTKTADAQFEMTPGDYPSLTTSYIYTPSDQRSFLRHQTPDLPSRSVRGSGQDSACNTIFRSDRASYRIWMSFNIICRYGASTTSQAPGLIFASDLWTLFDFQNFGKHSSKMCPGSRTKLEGTSHKE